MVFETGPNGRVYEIMSTGEEAHWADVGAWDPPHRFVLEWKLTAIAATEVEVRFTPEGDGTQVVLEHRHWDRLGAGAAETRDGYDGGWEMVLGRYVEKLA